MHVHCVYHAFIHIRFLLLVLLCKQAFLVKPENWKELFLVYQLQLLPSRSLPQSKQQTIMSKVCCCCCISEQAIL